MAARDSKKKVQTALCPNIPYDGSAAGCQAEWVPPFRKSDIGKWIRDSHTTVCCVCNTWQLRTSCFAVMDRDLLKSAMDATAEEEDFTGRPVLAQEDRVDGVTLDAHNNDHPLHWCSRCRRFILEKKKLPP